MSMRVGVRNISNACVSRKMCESWKVCKSWAIVIFVLTSLISLSNFITLDRKRNLQKPGILPSFDTDASLFGE